MPVEVRGAYFIGTKSEKSPTLDFFVLDPNKKVVLSKRKKAEGLIAFNATIPGQYSLIFSNLKVFPF